MKITKMNTTPVVVREKSKGLTARPVCSAPGSGCLTSTGMGGLAKVAPRWVWGRATISRSLDFLLQALQHFGGAFERPGACEHAPQTLYFFPQSRLVARQVARKLIDLRHHQSASPRAIANASSVTHMTATTRGINQYCRKSYERGENEAQQYRKRYRHQHLAAKIEGRNHDNAEQYGRQRCPGNWIALTLRQARYRFRHTFWPCRERGSEAEVRKICYTSARSDFFRDEGSTFLPDTSLVSSCPTIAAEISASCAFFSCFSCRAAAFSSRAMAADSARLPACAGVAANP